MVGVEERRAGVEHGLIVLQQRARPQETPQPRHCEAAVEGDQRSLSNPSVSILIGLVEDPGVQNVPT